MVKYFTIDGIGTALKMVWGDKTITVYRWSGEKWLRAEPLYDGIFTGSMLVTEIKEEGAEWKKLGLQK